VGTEIISTSNSFEVQNENDRVQRSVFDLGDISEGDSEGDGWDDVRGKAISMYIKRSPDETSAGRWNLHAVEVA